MCKINVWREAKINEGGVSQKPNCLDQKNTHFSEWTHSGLIRYESKTQGIIYEFLFGRVLMSFKLSDFGQQTQL